METSLPGLLYLFKYNTVPLVSISITELSPFLDKLLSSPIIGAFVVSQMDQNVPFKILGLSKFSKS